MSLIHLSSQGDNGGTATRFSNFFPNPIVIEPNSQVALVNVVLNPNGNIQIDDSNNSLFFSIGVITGATPNPQHKITVAEGEYSPQLLADTLTDLLNAQTTQQPYRKLVGGTLGWNVSIVKDTTTQEPRAFKFSNTQNTLPAVEGFDKVADYQTIHDDAWDPEDGQNLITQTIAGTAMLRVVKADGGEGGSDDEYQYAIMNKRGIYRGLSNTGGKPAIYYHFAPYTDDGGDGAYHTFSTGIIQSSYVENADGTLKNFDEEMFKPDADDNDVPLMDIGIMIMPNDDTTGVPDVGLASVVVLNNTKNIMEAKTLETGHTYPLNGDSTGYLFKMEWQTNTQVRIYVSEATDYTSFTHLYTATKAYSTSLDQLYQIAYNYEAESSFAISGIFNPDIIPNVFQMRDDTVMLKEPDLTAEQYDDSGLTTYRDKVIRMSVGVLANDQYLSGEGTIGETIGANEALLTLTTIDATFQEATYTTSGRPSFHGNLGTAHISLPNLPIKSYLGKSSNIGKDIAIIPRFESDSIDPSDALFYEASEKNWIDLKNVEEITTNELTVGIKDSSNKDLEGIHKPTAITILFRKKRM